MKRHKKPADWFTSHGDVFPVGRSKMKPFPPVAPNGRRSFPSKNLSKGVDEWNHYYIRCINGEVRLWVNGEEVSGGTNCEPKTGDKIQYLVLMPFKPDVLLLPIAAKPFPAVHGNLDVVGKPGLQKEQRLFSQQF